MSPIQVLICACLLYLVAIIVLTYLAWRSAPLVTHDGHTEAAPGGTAAPLQPPPAGVRSPVDVDSPPVSLKLPPLYSDGDLLVTCKRVLLITGCSDGTMWYSKMIGQEVPYLGEWKTDKCFKSREPAGYVNIVYFKDARVIIKEAGK